MAKRKANMFDRFGRVCAYDSKYTGEEPRWDDIDALTTHRFLCRRASMLNFYNYYLDLKNLKNSVISWMELHGYDRTEVKKFKSVYDFYFSYTAAKICRAMTLGMPATFLGSDHNDEKFIRDEIARCMNFYKLEMGDVKSLETQPKEVVSPIKRLENKVNETVVFYLDELLDEVLATSKDKVKSSVNILALLKGNTIPANGIKYVELWLKFHLDELQSALDKTCDDCVEGYSYLSKTGLRNRIKVLQKMLDDTVKYKDSIKKTRTPRKRKTPSIDKQIKRLKYLNEDTELGVTSVSPANIPGARKVITYNTKYKRLTVFDMPSGAQIKGTTLIGFDVEKSFSLTLRKPEDVLTAVIKKRTDNQIMKIIDELKTKRKEANGRINDKTLIVKVL